MTSLESLIFLIEVLQDIANTQTCAARFLAVSGADALACSAYFVLALGCLVGTVQHSVGGQDEMCTLADVQTALEVVAGSLQLLGFLHEEVGSNDAAIANDVELAFIKDAARNAAEHKLLAFKDDGVSGVRSSGETRHDIILRCKHIYDFTFSFVAEYDA